MIIKAERYYAMKQVRDVFPYTEENYKGKADSDPEVPFSCGGSFWHVAKLALMNGD